jgi:hypothetical protein
MTNQVGSKAWTQNRLAARLGLRYPIIQGPLGGLSSQRLTAAVSNISLTLGGSFALMATSTCKSPRCEPGFRATATLAGGGNVAFGRSPPTQMLGNNENKAGQTTEAD